jgi:hypothetical protein
MTMKQRNKARAITFVYSFQPVYRYGTVVYGPLYWKKFTSSRRELGPFSPLDSVAFLVRCGKSQKPPWTLPRRLLSSEAKRFLVLTNDQRISSLMLFDLKSQEVLNRLQRIRILR